jgi:hypothetical protein
MKEISMKQKNVNLSAKDKKRRSDGDMPKAKRLKFVDGRNVRSTKIRQEGTRSSTKYFVMNDNAPETQIFTYNALNMRNKRVDQWFKFDNGLDLPCDAKIRQEGTRNHTKYFVVNSDGSETQVFTPNALNMRSKRKDPGFKFVNGLEVSCDAKICQKGRKYYIMHDNGTKTQVFRPNALRMQNKRRNRRINTPLPHISSTEAIKRPPYDPVREAIAFNQESYETTDNHFYRNAWLSPELFFSQKVSLSAQEAEKTSSITPLPLS